MATPKDVKRHAAAAEAAFAEVYNKKPEDDQGTKADVIGDHVDSHNETTTDIPEEVKKEEVKKEDKLTSEYVPPSPDKKEPPKKEVDWEQKYNTLNGKYIAEGSRLQDQIKMLQNDLATAQAALAAINKKEEPQAKPSTVDLGLTQEEIDEYGEDLINVIKKAVTNNTVAPEVDTLKAEIATLKSSLEGINEKSTQSDKNRVLSDLTAAIPDWEAQNADPQFIGWLEQQDPYSGLQRQQLLDSAMENNDSDRVINFFNGFRAEYRITQAPQADEQPNAKLDLAEATAPGKTRSNETPTLPGNKQTWTQAQVAQFYKDVSAGKYANKQKEKRKIEQQIISAGQEGRLVA